VSGGSDRIHDGIVDTSGWLNEAVRGACSVGRVPMWRSAGFGATHCQVAWGAVGVTITKNGFAEPPWVRICCSARWNRTSVE
jgi:hypothetical protein